jgi:hypothetical protein
MTRVALASALFLVLAPGTRAAGLSIDFVPEAEQYAAAAEEYRRIWDADGARIIDAMQRVSGLTFQEDRIEAIVFEGMSYSGVPGEPMKLRASYPTDVKKATVVHELGHRLTFQLGRPQGEIDEHRRLFLFLYDVWVDLYGDEFAAMAVDVERGRKGYYDYAAAWDWALAMTRERRAATLKGLAPKR